MTTTQSERPLVDIGTTGTRSPWMLIGLTVIGLLIGLLGGWALFGGTDVIAVDGGDITDRQFEMTETIDGAFDAWISDDVDAVLSYYTDTATFVAGDIEYAVADGSLAAYIRTVGAGTSQMESAEPKLVVDGNTVVSFHTYQGTTLMNVFDFTPIGDVLIARHEVTS